LQVSLIATVTLTAAAASDFGWRNASALRYQHHFNCGFSRRGKNQPKNDFHMEAAFRKRF